MMCIGEGLARMRALTSPSVVSPEMPREISPIIDASHGHPIFPLIFADELTFRLPDVCNSVSRAKSMLSNALAQNSVGESDSSQRIISGCRSSSDRTFL